MAAQQQQGTGGPDPETAAALAEFTRQRDELAVTARDLESTTLEVSSADGAITVTMTLAGAVTGLRFAGDRHRELTGAELAAQLLGLLTRARQETGERAEELTTLRFGSAPAPLQSNDPLGDALAGLEQLFGGGSTQDGAGR